MRKGIIPKCDLNRNREIELVVGKETRSKVKTYQYKESTYSSIVNIVNIWKD